MFAGQLSSPVKPSYVGRVLSSDIVRKGLASAAASVIVAALVEAIWGGDEP